MTDSYTINPNQIGANIPALNTPVAPLSSMFQTTTTGYTSNPSSTVNQQTDSTSSPQNSNSSNSTPSATLESSLASVKDNPLNAYASYNCLFTLASLTKDQLNSGKFNVSSLKGVIVSSKGDWNNAAKRAMTDFGQFDYFIDDVIISSIISANKATGNTTGLKITFKVIEPYSMGLFLIALQQAAKANGYLNHRVAPYMFAIEFAGYKDDLKPSINPSLTRYIPIIILSAKLKVTSAGSTYECEAVPYNEVAYRDQFAKTIRTTKIKGNTVKDLLTGKFGLEKGINEMFSDEVAKGLKKGTDKIKIIFPKDFSDPNNSENEISKSQIFVDLNDAGQVKFHTDPTVFFDNVRQIYKSKPIGTVSVEKDFIFPAGAKYQDIINEIVIRSNYITSQYVDGALKTDSYGMMNWFRIETQVHDVDYNDEMNRHNRLYIFRVAPYKVHSERFTPPNVKPAGYTPLASTVSRVYNYMYTGKNTDVLNINLDYDMAFFASFPSDGTRSVGTNSNNFSTAVTTDPATKPADSGAVPAGKEPTLTVEQVAAGLNQQRVGGSGSDGPPTAQTRVLQSILTNPGDLINLELTIRGDPYYIPNSGIGNQITQQQGKTIMSDGALNYQNGQVDVVVVFRTPIDFNVDTGLYNFHATVDQFSGLFMVLEIESKITHNNFTQVLKLIRRRAQLEGSSKATTLFDNSKPGSPNDN